MSDKLVLNTGTSVAAPAPPEPLPVVLVVAAVTAAVVVYLSPTTAVSVCPRLIKDTVE